MNEISGQRVGGAGRPLRVSPEQGSGAHRIGRRTYVRRYGAVIHGTARSLTYALQAGGCRRGSQGNENFVRHE